MNKSQVYFILLLIFFHAFAKVGYVVYWRIHQATIAATTCINKDKPAMKCKGKCQLMKMAAPDASKDSKATVPPLHKQPNPFLYILEDAHELFLVFSELNQGAKQYPLYKQRNGYNHQISFFHPPERSLVS